MTVFVVIALWGDFLSHPFLRLSAILQILSFSQKKTALPSQFDKGGRL